MNAYIVAFDARTASAKEIKRTIKSLQKNVPAPVRLIAINATTALGAVLEKSIRRSSNVELADNSRIGDHIIFMRCGDALAPNAIELLNEFVAAHPDRGMIYGDSTHGSVSRWDEPTQVRRPQWSPERLRSHCYVGEMIIAPHALVAKAGGTAALISLHPHDRALRLSEFSPEPLRIAEILYESDQRHLQPTCSADAVREHCARTNISATVLPDEHLPLVRVRRTATASPRISVIIPTRGTTEEIRGQNKVLAAHAIETLITRSTYTNFEIIVVADEQTPNEARGAIAAAGSDKVRFVEFNKPFNFADKINLGAVCSDSELLLLLNDDTEMITPDALETMVGLLADPGVAMVGPMLVYEDGAIQSAGHILNPVPYDLYRSRPLTHTGAQHLLRVQREVSGVIAACALIKRDAFNEAGGLCTHFPSNYNDVDFGLKLRELGYRVLFTPYAQFFHFESLTRSPKLQLFEVAKIGARWRDKLDDDPYFNPKLERYVSTWKQNVIGQRSLLDAFGPTAPIASK